MRDETPDLKFLNARLEKLEAQNRRMKKAGTIAIVFAAVIVISGQANTSKVTKVIEANAFRLVDAKGNLRASLEILGDQAELSLTSPRGQSDVLLGSDANGPFLLMNGSEAKQSAALNPGTFSLEGTAGKLSIDVDDIRAPNLTLEDNEGYSSVLGRSDLVVSATGRKERTPAASLVLFGKNQKVLWSAP